MSNSSDSKVLGVVLLIRHGDRQGFYQNPITYDPSRTAITPLGNAQEFQLGQWLRSVYFDSSSPSFISGVNATIADQTQYHIRADGGGEGGVIFNSAISLLQGLWPATPLSVTHLANGSTVEGPLNGYQYIAVESVEPVNDISLEGWTSCGTFNNATNNFYNSAVFEQKAADNTAFLNQLPQFVAGRTVTLQNMWNIFDFMNVESIHDATFAKALPPTFLEQARDLANFHEYGVFSAPNVTGIGNIAGQAILPSILSGFSSIVNGSNPLKFVYEAISYKPFISLFNMTGAAQQQPEIAGVVNYAAVVALEVRQPASGGEPVLRFNFKNGTDDASYRTLNFLGATGDVPLSTFVSKLSPAAINDLPTWCNVCQNNQDRGCAAIAQASVKGAASVHLHQRIGPVGAGFLGAGVTLALVILMFIVLFFLGLLSLGRGKRGKRAGGSVSDHGSLERKV